MTLYVNLFYTWNKIVFRVMFREEYIKTAEVWYKENLAF